jgi:fatty acyl-CoA reductase
MVALSSSRRRADGGVSCGIANGYMGGSGASRPPSLPVHGKSSAPSSAPVPDDDHAEGLGIQEFLGGKNFLITGGTGFLAKGMRMIFPSFSVFHLISSGEHSDF